MQNLILLLTILSIPTSIYAKSKFHKKLVSKICKCDYADKGEYQYLSCFQIFSDGKVKTTVDKKKVGFCDEEKLTYEYLFEKEWFDYSEKFIKTNKQITKATCTCHKHTTVTVAYTELNYILNCNIDLINLRNKEKNKKLFKDGLIFYIPKTCNEVAQSLNQKLNILEGSYLEEKGFWL